MIYALLNRVLLFAAPALAAVANRRSLSIRWQLIFLGICILYGSCPLLLAWGGLWLAERFNCEGYGMLVFHCPDFAWLGSLTSLMVFTHWFAMLTVPSAVLGCLGLLISLGLKVNALRINVNTSERSTGVFYRSRQHKIISGMCAATAQQLRLPISAVRIVIVMLVVVFPRTALSLYLWCWLAFPQEPLQNSI